MPVRWGDPDRPYLGEDTVEDNRAQRMDEQAFKRTLATVHAKDHSHENDASAQNEQTLETSPQHPILGNLQWLDGTNVEPTKADIENELNRQQQEYQLRMGLTPGVKWQPPTPFSGG